MLSQKGDVGEVVGVIGSTLRAPHVDSDMIHTCFGWLRWVAGAEMLEGIAREWVTVELRTGSDLASDLACGNHRNAAKYGGHVLANAVADALSRAIEYPATRANCIVVLRISSIRVMEKKKL